MSILILRKYILVCLTNIIASIALHVPHMQPLFNPIKLMLKTLIHQIFILLQFWLATFKKPFGTTFKMSYIDLFIIYQFVLIILHPLELFKMLRHIVDFFPKFFSIISSIYSLFVHPYCLFLPHFDILHITGILFWH